MTLPTVLSFACILACIAICAVVMFFNASFWASVGHDLRAQVGFAVAIIAVDGIKVMMLPLAAAAIARGLRTCAITAVGLWAMLTGFSQYSAWGFAMLNAGQTVSTILALTSEVKEKRFHLKQLERKRSSIRDDGPSELTGIHLKELQFDPKFRSTAGCLRVSVQSSPFCAEYRAAVTKDAMARVSAELDGKMQTLRAEVLATEHKITVLRLANPASVIERALGWSDGEGWALVNAWMIAVLEMASGLGMYVALRVRMAERGPEPPPPSHWDVVPRTSARNKRGRRSPWPFQQPALQS